MSCISTHHTTTTTSPSSSTDAGGDNNTTYHCRLTCNDGHVPFSAPGDVTGHVCGPRTNYTWSPPFTDSYLCLSQFYSLLSNVCYLSDPSLCILPTRRYAGASLCESNVSVCPSVTSRYCVKTTKASVMISSPSGSTAILVFWCQISSRHSKRSPPQAEASNQGGVGKFSHFLALSINISKTVAGTAKVTYELSIDTKIDDRGWPWRYKSYKVKLYRNFAWFRDFGRQQWLNE